MWGSSILMRQRNTSPSPPRSKLRTSLRLRPVLRVISLIDLPDAASVLIAWSSLRLVLAESIRTAPRVSQSPFSTPINNSERPRLAPVRDAPATAPQTVLAQSPCGLQQVGPRTTVQGIEHEHSVELIAWHPARSYGNMQVSCVGRVLLPRLQIHSTDACDAFQIGYCEMNSGCGELPSLPQRDRLCWAIGAATSHRQAPLRKHGQCLTAFIGCPSK